MDRYAELPGRTYNRLGMMHMAFTAQRMFNV